MRAYSPLLAVLLLAALAARGTAQRRAPGRPRAGAPRSNLPSPARPAPAPAPATISPADEAAVRSLIDEFHAALARGDVDGVMTNMTSPSSRGEFRRQLQALFAARDYVPANLVLSRLQVAGVSATLRVGRNVVTTRRSDGRKDETHEALTFFCRREGQGAAAIWKIDGFQPAVVDV